MLRVSDSAGRMSRLALAPRILLPSLPPYEVGAPEGVITDLPAGRQGSMAGLRAALSTLATRPRGRAAMTRGRGGALLPST